MFKGKFKTRGQLTKKRSQGVTNDHTINTSNSMLFVKVDFYFFFLPAAVILVHKSNRIDVSHIVNIIKYIFKHACQKKKRKRIDEALNCFVYLFFSIHLDMMCIRMQDNELVLYTGAGAIYYAMSPNCKNIPQPSIKCIDHIAMQNQNTKLCKSVNNKYSMAR